MSFISRFSIRTRLLVGILLPVFLTAVVISWLTVDQLHSQGVEEVELLRTNLIDAHKAGLNQIVEAARTAIDEAYTDTSLDETEAQNRVRDIIRSMGFGDNNY